MGVGPRPTRSSASLIEDHDPLATKLGGFYEARAWTTAVLN